MNKQSRLIVEMIVEGGDHALDVVDKVLDGGAFQDTINGFGADEGPLRVKECVVRQLIAPGHVVARSYTAPEQRVLAAARAVASAHAAYDASGHPDDFVKLKRALAAQDEAVQAIGDER